MKKVVSLLILLVFFAGCAPASATFTSAGENAPILPASQTIIPASEVSDESSPDESSTESSSRQRSAEKSSEAVSSSESKQSEEISSNETVSSKPEASSEPESSVQSAASSAPETSSLPEEQSYTETDEMRGVWISFYELSDITDYEEYKNRIDTMFDTIKAIGFNAVFFHVHAFGDALYPSEIFPFSHRIGYKTVNGDPIQGVDPGYDPLEYAVNAAHERGLQLHAWWNPYRIWTLSDDIEDLSVDNPAYIFLTDDDPTNDNYVLSTGKGLYYNPAEQGVRDLITAGIAEMLNNYAVDGVHFDDYFYPTTDADFDAVSYRTYKTDGGLLSLDDWRRENVDKLLMQVHELRASKGVPFGVSPAGNIDRVMNEMYADVALWGSSYGYVDYLCPQIYWGFDHDTMPFLGVLNDWLGVVTNPSVKLFIGLPAYKLGETDSAAGSGKYEFKNDTEILKRMVLATRETDCDGFIIYSYTAMADSANAAETEALRGLLE